MIMKIGSYMQTGLDKNNEIAVLLNSLQTILTPVVKLAYIDV